MSYSPATSSFPTSKTTLTDPSSSSDTGDFDHAGLESAQNDAIEKLETAIGITGSTDTDSLTYKLTNTSQSDPGHKHTLATGATDVTSTAVELNVLSGIPATLTATELGYVDGVTSAIQTQINAKQATITGAATTITSSNLTASKALISNGSGKVAVSSVTDTELGYVSGVTSAIQTQITGIVRKAMINSISSGTYSSGGTNYIYPCSVGDPNGTESARQSTFPACTLKKLYFNVTANTLNNNLVVTVRDDASGTTLTKTVAATVTGVQSVASDVSVADGSQISIQIVTTAAGSGSATIANMTLVYEITS